MRTTAQDTLTAFENSLSSMDMTTKTDSEIIALYRQHLVLQSAATIEIAENSFESEQEAAAAEIARLASIKEALTAKGFACDNSEADWDLLYDRPEIFGANWKVQADYQRGISTGVDYFLQTANTILTC